MDQTAADAGRGSAVFAGSLWETVILHSTMVQLITADIPAPSIFHFYSLIKHFQQAAYGK
ncbi:hypothetical protein AB833_22815 [Chromatiales bacterium (ex Bugula neritina AB1)]|nr:hypothetical protein AB833_22815 [Chromatiales bacterium (ex Bugula neritina AB1)]